MFLQIKSLAILPYLLLSIVASAASLCIIPSQVHLSTTEGTLPNELLMIVCYVFVLIFSIYFTLCVYSLYEIIKFSEKRRKDYKNGEPILIIEVQE
jgi:heme/copper-type cytochrome/quinol oxidase subunit 2